MHRQGARLKHVCGAKAFQGALGWSTVRPVPAQGTYAEHLRSRGDLLLSAGAVFTIVDQALAQGRPRIAFEALLPLVRHPAIPDSDVLRRLAASVEGWPAPVPIEPLIAVGRAPTDATTLRRFGVALVSANLPGLAAGVLARALAIDPTSEPIQTELVAALQLLGDHAAARRVLDAAPPARGFLRRYLDAFSAVMTSDIDAARERAALLAPSDDAERFMASRLERIFARHTSVASVTALDAHDVRGWHFVLSGSLLLHVPADSDTAERRAAHGRYAYVADSPALVLEVVERLEAVLAALDLSGMVVHPLDQIDSRVIGTVIADRQGVHARPTLTPVAPGLVTAWDFEAVLADLRAPFAHHREGQVTFAHALCHGHEQRFTPDVVGFLYDQRRPPFAPTETDEAAMVRAIKDATLPDGALDDLGDVVALAVVAQADGVLALQSSSGVREPLWLGGPAAG